MTDAPYRGAPKEALARVTWRFRRSSTPVSVFVLVTLFLALPLVAYVCGVGGFQDSGMTLLVSAAALVVLLVIGVLGARERGAANVVTLRRDGGPIVFGDGVEASSRGVLEISHSDGHTMTGHYRFSDAPTRFHFSLELSGDRLRDRDLPAVTDVIAGLAARMR